MWPLTQSQPPNPTPRPKSLPTIEVDAGPLTRSDTPVSFTLPPTTRGESLQLRETTNNTTIPLQLTTDRTAWFIVENLKAGETRRYVIEPTLDRQDPTWIANTTIEPDFADLSLQQHTTLHYQMEKSHASTREINPIFERGGYLHPVRTPSGAVVTDDYPPSHPNHHGIWTAWTQTQFQGRSIDFSNIGDHTGIVEFEALLNSWSGPVHAGLRARHRLVDTTTITPITALTEIWEVTLYAVGLQPQRPFRMFDVTTRLDAASPDPFLLRESHYGGLAFHGPRHWNTPDSSPIVLTSEAKTRTNGDGTRARWCYIGGMTNGSQAGIAILADPHNFRAPEPLYIHPTDPVFNFAPTQLGPFTITPGHPLVMHYRFITFDGPPDPAWIEQLWQQFANPVKVRT
jgi:hypothetical protein